MKKITVEFLMFSLEWHSYCGYDSLKLYNGNFLNDTALGNANGYCGNNIPPTLNSIGNVVLIVFRSDGSHTSSGFRISYKIRGTFYNIQYAFYM